MSLLSGSKKKVSSSKTQNDSFRSSLLLPPKTVVHGGTAEVTFQPQVLVVWVVWTCEQGFHLVGATVPPLMSIGQDDRVTVGIILMIPESATRGTTSGGTMGGAVTLSISLSFSETVYGGSCVLTSLVDSTFSGADCTLAFFF